MKYVALIKNRQGDVVEVSPLVCSRTAKFFETKNNELICVEDSILRKVIPSGDWAVLKGKQKISPMVSFMRPMVPSPELAEIVGKKPLMRTDVVKKLWAFIRKNELQDTENRRNINVGKNNVTKAIFKTDVISMFEMTKAVSKHLK